MHYEALWLECEQYVKCSYIIYGFRNYVRAVTVSLCHNSLITISIVHEFRSETIQECYKLFGNHLDDIPAMLKAILCIGSVGNVNETFLEFLLGYLSFTHL